MSAGPKRLFGFGLGYSLEALGRRLQARGWHISGTLRDANKRRRLNGWGWNCFIFDNSQPLKAEDAAAIIKELERASHLLFSIPPPPEPSDGYPPQITARGLPKSLDRVCSQIPWQGYLSSTAVYADSRGAWVDETSPPAPESKRGQARLKAERAWQQAQIFRLSGIYGPERCAFLSRPQPTTQGTTITNRITRSDIVSGLHAALARPMRGRIFNFSDNLPATTAQLRHYARCLQTQTPPAKAQPLAFPAKGRQVANHRLREELGVTLRYPDYRCAINALIAISPKPKA